MIPLIPGNSYHIFNHANGFENIFRCVENFRFFMEKYQLYISPVAETYAYCLMPNHFHVVVRIKKREVIEALIRNKDLNFGKVNRISITGMDTSIYFSKVNDESINQNFGKVNMQLEIDTNTDTNFSKVKTKVNDESINQNFGKVKKLSKINLDTNTNFSKVKKEISDTDIEKYISKQFSNLFSCYTQSFNKIYHRMGSLFIKNFKREQIYDKRHFLNAVIYTHRNPIHHSFCKNYNEWDFSSYNEIVDGNDNYIEITKLLKMYEGIGLFINIHRFALKNFDNTTEFDMP